MNCPVILFWYFNCSVLFKLEELKKLLEISVVEDIEASIDEIVKDINSRNKLIKIADRTDGGWTIVEEYQQIDYADDSDDDRKIRQANARALQKKRRLQRRTPASATTDINHRGHLFRAPPPPPRGTEPRAPRTPASAAVLGDTSDVTVEHRSPTVCRQKSLLSRATHSHFPGVRQRYLPHKREVPENSGTEVKYNFTSFADNKTDLQFSSICEDGCDLARNVKGSLKRNVEFWKSISAYDSVIDIITNGYRIPFIHTPLSRFFKNNGSALRNSEFVRETILELLRSGRMVETCSAPTVVNPLTVSINASGKKRLILDLRYINQFIWKQRFRLDDWKN